MELFHTDTCHIWRKALEELDASLKGGKTNATVKAVVVSTKQQAEKHRFLGSPTIHVNGKDVDPMAEKLTRYNLASCRTYWWKGQSSEYPPKGMIREAIAHCPR